MYTWLQKKIIIAWLQKKLDYNTKINTLIKNGKQDGNKSFNEGLWVTLHEVVYLNIVLRFIHHLNK